MEHESLGPIALEEAEEALASGDAEAISMALLRLALNYADWRVVQEKCLAFTTHQDVWVRRNAATALGHLARLHRQVDTAVVIPALEALRSDPDVASWAEAALDDLAVFLRSGTSH